LSSTRLDDKGAGLRKDIRALQADRNEVQTMKKSLLEQGGPYSFLLRSREFVGLAASILSEIVLVMWADMAMG